MDVAVTTSGQRSEPILTTIVTDTPIAGAPDPRSLVETIGSFAAFAPALARHVRIVFDGADLGSERQALKLAPTCRVSISEKTWSAYKSDALRALRITPFGQAVESIELPRRGCLAVVMRAGINGVSTPFVAYVQSDLPLRRPLDVRALLSQMHSQPGVQKVMFTAGVNSCHIRSAWRICRKHRNLGNPSRAVAASGALPLSPIHLWFVGNHIATLAHYTRLANRPLKYGDEPQSRLFCEPWTNHSKWGTFVLGRSDDGQYSAVSQSSSRVLDGCLALKSSPPPSREHRVKCRQRAGWRHGCVPSCRANSTQSHAIRKAFGQPHGFGSCAVVGASGALLHMPGLGREIDAHEFVVRTNIAPVGGFAELVGRGTSLRVMNTEALGTALLERGCPRLRDGDRSWCPPYGLFIN
jgi:hypothetical protein